MYIADGILTTACVPDCNSRITWEYDAGEPRSWEHPGTPEEIWPATGCVYAEHLLAITPEDFPSRYHEVWQQLATYLRLLDSSHALWLSSLHHLVGPHGYVNVGGYRDGLAHRGVTVPALGPWQRSDGPDLDELPF